jgi:hypothetical protein
VLISEVPAVEVGGHYSHDGSSPHRHGSPPADWHSVPTAAAMPQRPACMSGKRHQKRNSRARRPRVHSTRIYEMLHSDIMEMPIAKDGSRYVITLTGDYSLGSWAYAIRWKNEALQKFRQFEARVH